MKGRNGYDDEESSSSLETGEFKQLKIKISEERSECDNDDSPPLPQSKHFCSICKKQFSSGKAYGGHVRIHSIEYNNKGKTKKMKKTKRKSVTVKKDKEIDLIRADDDDDDVEDDNIKCFLCEKEFPTINSLFGHMRRHPGRNWKGIRPPPPPQTENFSLMSFLDDSDDDDDDDEYEYDDVSEEVYDAACVIMTMPYDKRSKVISLSSYKDDKGKEKVVENGGKKDDIVDMKIKKVNNLGDEAENRSLEIDLNQPCNEDHPFAYWK